MRRVISSVILVFGLITMAGCWTGTPGQSHESVRIARSLSIPSAPLFIAENQALWKEEGLSAEYSDFVAGRLCLDAILAGDVDVGTVAATPLVNAALEGHQFRVLATIALSTKQEGCVARRDHQISHPSDLRGKTIGVFFGTAAEYYLELFLQTYGVPADDCTLINVRPADSVSAIVGGDVDAVCTWQPHLANIQRELGEGAVLFQDEGLYTFTWNLVSLPEFPERNPEQAEKVIRVLQRAADWAEAHPEESIAVVTEALSMDTEILRSVWGSYQFNLTLNDELVDLLQQEGKWAADRKQEEVPDFRPYLDFGPMKDAGLLSDDP